MKLFDPYAALAKIEESAGTPATSATTATQTPETPPSVAKVASVATPEPQTPKIEAVLRTSDMRHGTAINGHPKTWTGKVVSLEAWRELSEWEKHGPDGRVWDGRERRWRLPDDAL